MTVRVGLAKWVFTLVEKSSESEKIIGLHHSSHDIRFIPVYLDRETAQRGAPRLIAENNFEIHAIIFEDILRYAAQSRYLIFILAQDGSIVSKISPDGRTL